MIGANDDSDLAEMPSGVRSQPYFRLLEESIP